MPDSPMVVVYPRGQLTPEDKALLREVGIIAIEADDPKSVQQLRITAPLVNTAINGDMIVRAALSAIADQTPETSGGSITNTGRAAHAFVKLLAHGLNAKDPQ